VEPVAVVTDIPVRTGERVVLTHDSGSAVLQILKLFFLPLVGFWGAFGLGTLIPGAGELPAALAGIAGFLLVFLLIRLTERRKNARGRYFYRISARVSSTPTGS
jgi:positive regulator of sigma E activity